MKSFTPVVLLGLACALGLPLGAQPDRVNGRAFATRSEIIAQHGMAATSHPLATQVALDILKAGGSAKARSRGFAPPCSIRTIEGIRYTG